MEAGKTIFGEWLESRQELAKKGDQVVVDVFVHSATGSAREETYIKKNPKNFTSDSPEAAIAFTIIKGIMDDWEVS